jgi:hypothetical protein
MSLGFVRVANIRFTAQLKMDTVVDFITKFKCIIYLRKCPNEPSPRGRKLQKKAPKILIKLVAAINPPAYSRTGSVGASSDPKTSPSASIVVRKRH